MAAKSKYLTNSNHDAAQETPGFPSAQNSCYRDESPEVAELHLGGHTSVSSAKKRRTWNQSGLSNYNTVSQDPPGRQAPGNQSAKKGNPLSSLFIGSQFARKKKKGPKRSKRQESPLLHGTIGSSAEPPADWTAKLNSEEFQSQWNAHFKDQPPSFENKKRKKKYSSPLANLISDIDIQHDNFAKTERDLKPEIKQIKTAKLSKFLTNAEQPKVQAISPLSRPDNPEVAMFNSTLYTAVSSKTTLQPNPSAPQPKTSLIQKLTSQPVSALIAPTSLPQGATLSSANLETLMRTKEETFRPKISKKSQKLAQQKKLGFFAEGRYEQDLEERRQMKLRMEERHQAELAQKERLEMEEINRNNIHKRGTKFNKKNFDREYAD